MGRARIIMLAEGLVSGLGFVLLLIGLHVSSVLAIVGGVIACIGAGLGVRALALARRDRGIGSTGSS